MARPNGSRKIRGWIMTPTEMAKAGLIDPADLERVVQGGVEVTQVKPSAVKGLDEELERLKQDARSGDDEFFLVDTEGAKEALASLVEAKRATNAPRSEIERKVFAEEKRIRNNTYESGILIAADGKVYRNKGNDYSVGTSDEQRSKMAGGIFTHNHPRAITDMEERRNPLVRKIGGNSFSPNDVLNMFYHGNREKRAVTPKLEFSMKNKDWEKQMGDTRGRSFPYVQSKKGYASLEASYQRNRSRVREKITRLKAEGKMTQNESGAAYWHLVNREFASGTRGIRAGLEYSVTGDSKALAELARIEKIYDEG